ncbi:hypothetical protein [Streptomyces sp. NPDC058657]|uniref:hypothetical protein n=1 Tax=unclassified Streptomyces TaxID=2593676 RepID=UPI00366196A5
MARHPGGPSNLLTLVYVAFLALPGHEEPSRSSVVGTWTSPEGGTLTFEDDGTFSGTAISTPDSCLPGNTSYENNRMSGSGTWRLGSFPEEGPGAGIHFEPSRGNPVKAFPVWAVLLSGPQPRTMYLLHDDGTGERYRRRT